jgi:hypothetical protein
MIKFIHKFIENVVFQACVRVVDDLLGIDKVKGHLTLNIYDRVFVWLGVI